MASFFPGHGVVSLSHLQGCLYQSSDLGYSDLFMDTHSKSYVATEKFSPHDAPQSMVMRQFVVYPSVAWKYVFHTGSQAGYPFYSASA